MNARQKRGRALALSAAIRQVDGHWIVPSASGAGKYIVTLDPNASCTCPFFQTQKIKCKHVFAVERRIEKDHERVHPRPHKLKPVSLIELAQIYSSKADCLGLLEMLRWPNGPVCPRCGVGDPYPLRDRHKFECANQGCSYHFSVTAGTVMHDTRLPLTKWILATALLVNARKGVSACQVSRDLHVTYKTAWYLCHRIRRAMRETAWLKKFTGIVELDETYIGGRARGKRGRGAANKTPVFGVRERNGHVRIKAVANVTGKTIAAAVHKYVETNAAMVIADEYGSYNQLAGEFTLERIQHAREYVRGEIHTNGIESIWAIVKRQVNGTHHKMSEQYLPLYLNEISYRFNHRREHDLFMKVLRNGLLTDRQVLTEPEAAETMDGSGTGAGDGDGSSTVREEEQMD